MSRTVFTHKLALCSSLQLLRQYPILFDCSTWYFIMAARARQTIIIVQRSSEGAGFSIHWIHYSWKELKDSTLNFQNRWKGLQRHLPLTTIFMQSFCSSRRYWLHMGKISVVAKIDCHRFEHRSLRSLWTPPYRISRISFASVMLECRQICHNWLIRGYTRTSFCFASLFFVRRFSRCAPTNWTPGRG